MQRALALALAVLAVFPAPVSAADPPPASAAAAPADDPLTVKDVEIVAERDAPQVCVAFSGRLERSAGADYRPWVSISPVVNGAVVPRDRSLCLEGFQHGQGYRITLKNGLMAGDGRTLAEDDTREVDIPNRRAALTFRGAGYILPRLGGEGLSLRSINVGRVKLQILRMPDPAVIEQIHQGRANQQLTDNDIGAIVEKAGQEVWKGEMAVTAARNTAAVTPFPVDAVVGKLDPGVYVAVASAEEVREKDWASRATQWFLVTDLGLNTVRGDDGLLVFARSIATAQPLEGVELRLLARDHSERAKVVTGADGIARVTAQALAGTAQASEAAAPASPAPVLPAQVLLARRGGDLALMDLTTAADRPPPAAALLEPPKALDAWISPARGIFRPGERAALTVLLRDGDANAVTGRPLTLKLLRPDGFEADRRILAEAGAGAYAVALDLAANAMTGLWTATVHEKEDGPAIGTTRFQVEEFVPPRLVLALSGDRPALGGAGTVAVTVDARDLYGAPAGGLPGEATLTLRPAEAPIPGLNGYRFGQAQEAFSPQRVELPGFTTGDDGKARLTVALSKLPDTTRPLEAVVRATVFDIGGRPVSRDMVVPVHHQPFAIGIRPRFEGQGVPEGASAGFDVVAVGPDGALLDQPDLSFDLFEEIQDYRWVEANGRWDYEAQTRETRVTGGKLAVKASAPAVVEEPVQAGHYRLEVFDAKTGVASAVRFGAGWWAAAPAAGRPDTVDVRVMLPAYKGGDTARVHVRPPYRSQVLITIADRSVRLAMTRTIGPEGAFLDIPVDPSWTAGAYVVATAFPLPEAGQKGVLRRAVGLSWLGIDPAPRTLDVSLSAPVTVEPRRPATASVTVRGVAAGKPAFVALAAVDESVLKLAPFQALDPVAYFLGRRGLGVELRDVYGRLIDTDPAAKEPAVDLRRPRPGAAVPPRNRQVVSLFSGILPVGADGTVAVPLDLPDFHGRLRLMVAAWSEGKLGRADGVLTVAERVMPELSLPRALAPGDAADIVLTLDGVAGTAGNYGVRLSAADAVTLEGEGAATLALLPGRRASLTRTLRASRLGGGVVRLALTGPDGLSLEREWPVMVRGAGALPIRRQSGSLGADKPLAPGADLAAGLLPGSVSAAVSAGLPADLDLPGLLLAVDRPVAVGVEPLASRILALLALTDGSAPLAPDLVDAARTRVPRALDRLLAVQRSDGAFSPWSPKDAADPWLTAYVLDVLGRAKAAGYAVADPAYRKGMDWLKQQTDNTWLEEDQLPARAYIGLVLARAKAVDAGAVRFFHESWWNRLPTDFARAQVAAALAAVGETKAATDAFAGLSKARMVSAGLHDYGSALRDEAAAVMLMADSGLADRDRMGAAIDHLARTQAAVTSTSVQEQGWLLQAMRSVAGRGGVAKLTVDGQPAESARPFLRRFDPAAAAPTLGNAGGEPVRYAVAVTGTPADPLPAEERGLRITRTLFTMDGAPITPAALRRNELVVVILEGESQEPLDRTLMVTDPLAAGVEIENVRLADSAPLGDLSWLGAVSAVQQVEYRDDRFVGVVDVTRDKPGFRLAYLARALVAGDFVQPGVTVEDLYRPSLFARGSAGRVRVVGE